MSSETPTGKAAFDDFSIDYDAALAQGLAVTGENKDFFASGRTAWLAVCLSEASQHREAILDFGCGTGSAAPFLLRDLAPKRILGVDVSAKSLEVARDIHGSAAVQFQLLSEYQPQAEMDLAYCNGVFHHIPLAERAEKVAYVHRSLRPGALFSFWENNPWNPGTRYVMSRTPFDRDAITLTPPEARRMLKAGGFEILRTDFLFFFPRLLSWFRRLEPSLVRIPLGAQYQILCRKR